MSGLIGKHAEENALRSPVPFPKGMNGIEFGQEVRRLVSENFSIEVTKPVVAGKTLKNAAHFPIDIFGITKHAFIFREADRADATCPFVHILKKMSVNSPRSEE